MKGLIKVIVIAILVTFAGSSFAQTSKELEKKKKEIQKEIEYKNKLLKETRRSRQFTMTELVIQRQEIANREDLITTINRELAILNREIRKTNTLIESLEEDLQQLKREYADMIYYAYKNKSAYDKLMFVFAAEDFNQAYKRLKYYQQYADYRERQVFHIKQTQQILAEKIADLEAKKKKKSMVLGEKKEEKSKLDNKKQEIQVTLQKLQDDEKKLKKELKEKQEQQIKLNKAIEKALAEERRKGSYDVNTPEAKELAASFEKNKGTLPWPVLKGVIVGRFGTRPHPVLKEIKVNNNGVDINTAEGTPARAVFNGEVTGVIIIPGAGKAVMVRHGIYLTVYSNLEETYVKKGDKVDLKQNIGKIVSDGEKTQLHFELWKEKTPVNPSDWLYLAK